MEFFRKLSAGVSAMALIVATAPAPASAQSSESTSIKHVLLISVDGLHAVDFLNCSNGVSTVNNGAPYCPAIAALGKTGVNYVAASTSKPSDSFPGLTAIITGGSPALTGV
jgi:predicted AlkP superfamily pyrophosphatase or phosphodiesterase